MASGVRFAKVNPLTPSSIRIVAGRYWAHPNICGFESGNLHGIQGSQNVDWQAVRVPLRIVP
jgi:hypothetical protein